MPVRLVERGDHVDLAVITPCGAGDGVGDQAGEQGVDMVDHRPSHGLRRGDQHARRIGAVLGLAQQVDRDGERVGQIIGDDERFGRPGEEVDPDLAEQLALRLGHVGVAGAGQDGHRVDGLGAQCECGDACTPPRTKISSAPARCIAATLICGGSRHWGRRRGDPFDTCDLRGEDRHVRGAVSG